MRDDDKTTNGIPIMEQDDKNVVVMLTVGKSDNGSTATLALSCALSAVSLGHPTTLFLTGSGSVWGYRGSARGITSQGFPPLQKLIDQFLEAGGRILLCSVCFRTCGTGAPEDQPLSEILPGAEMGGFATVIELATNGTCITF